MKNKILFGFAIALLTLFLISGTYAIYKANTEGEVDLSLATWSVSVYGDFDDNLSLVAGRNCDSYRLTVNNGSEVTVTYSIAISNLPDGVNICIDNTSCRDAENGEVVFEDYDELLYKTDFSPTTKYHDLSFCANSYDTQEVSEHTIQIDVDFKQKTS